MVTNTLLRRPSVLSCTGYSNSTLYANIAAGLFPRPVKIGLRASAWPASELEAVNAARIAGKTEGEIRDLVKELHAKRALS